MLVSGLRPLAAVALGSGSDWPGYLHDISGSGFTSESLLNPSNAGSLATKAGWPVHLTNAAVCPSTNDYCSRFIASQPIIATIAGNTLVFVGAWNGSEYAICASSCNVGGTAYTSGQIVWATYVGRTSGCGGPLNSAIHGVTSAAAIATVQIAGVTRSVVYVGAGGDIAMNGSVIPNATSRLVALDSTTGAILWQTPLGSAPSYYLWSSPVYANGSLYIAAAHVQNRAGRVRRRGRLGLCRGGRDRRGLRGDRQREPLHGFLGTARRLGAEAELDPPAAEWLEGAGVGASIRQRLRIDAHAIHRHRLQLGSEALATRRGQQERDVLRV
jgi:hypothetical protein